MKRLLILFLFLATPLWAVNPDEMLADPVLEARAQALDKIIRCVQCQSEAIASSNAEWSRDARILLRELISEGMSDNEVLNFFEERYGERVLMKPRMWGGNLLLWLAGPLFLLLSLMMVAMFFASLKTRGKLAELSEDEQNRLEELLKEDR